LRQVNGQRPTAYTANTAWSTRTWYSVALALPLLIFCSVQRITHWQFFAVGGAT